jgi:hypothetical protein
MACEHKRIMSRNCELFCLDCGAKLDKAPEPEPVKKSVKRTAKKAKAD